MFDFLTFGIFLTTWHLFDILTHQWNLNHLSPHRVIFYWGMKAQNILSACATCKYRVLLEIKECLYATVGRVCVQPHIGSTHGFGQFLYNIKEKTIFGNCCVFLPQVWDEGQKIRLVRWIWITTRPNFPPPFIRFVRQKLFHTVLRFHQDNAFVNADVGTIWPIFWEELLHCLNNWPNFE